MNGSTAEQPGNGDKHGIETTRAKGKVPHKEDTPGDVSAINNDVNLVENGIDNISNVNNPHLPPPLPHLQTIITSQMTMKFSTQW